MSKLGVQAVLSPATECKDLCNPNGRKLAATYYTGIIQCLLFKLLAVVRAQPHLLPISGLSITLDSKQLGLMRLSF